MRCENWDSLVKEYAPQIGLRFVNEAGQSFIFYGLVHSDDDYYFGMQGQGKCLLLSCVGSLEAHGYTRVDNA